MDRNLRESISALRPVAQELADWGAVSLSIDTYLTAVRPPDHLVTSVRGIVLGEQGVLVVEEAEDRYHVVPGGRREGEESVVAALNREILEETGWTIAEPDYLGFAHFHHLTPRPAGHVYPYPDFCHLYFSVQARLFQPERKLDEKILRDEYVLSVMWRPIDAALQLPLDTGQLALLHAAKRRQAL